MDKEIKQEFNMSYYNKRSKSSLFHKRGDNPCVHRFWVRYIRKIKKSGKLLEVGCGEGYFLKRISPYFTTWGVDISKDGIDIAKKNASKANFKVSDAADLPFEERFFDVIVAFDVIEHLQSPELFFEEAFRVLNNNGMLVIKTPNPLSFGARIKGNLWSGQRDKTHISILTPEEWRNIIKKTGFAIKEEGTDTLWDSPYFKFVPASLQKLIFISLHYTLTYLFGMFPWKYGENYICVARKKQ